ncbi:hypothetical protein ACSFCT_09205 [Yokenella regensburgei]|uniref:hypothetical protein n=1 Tax=Yokenella regensburgei TaxID=158877 RepID=UPI003ED9FE73
MIDNRTASAIDQALERKPLPVYVVSRHGYVRRCFSRDTALWSLAKFMTRKVFSESGFAIEYDPIPEQRPEGEVWIIQGPTAKFKAAQRRCVRRLRQLMARKRAYGKWKEKLDALADQYHAHLKLDPLKQPKKENNNE